MQCNALETGSPRMNKSVFKIRQLQGPSIDGTYNNGKMADKISENYYSKFYMLQVMLFMTSDPAKNKK